MPSLDGDERLICRQSITYLLVDITVNRVIDTDILGEHSTLGELADGLDRTGSASLEGAVCDECDE